MFRGDVTHGGMLITAGRRSVLVASFSTRTPDSPQTGRTALGRRRPRRPARLRRNWLRGGGQVSVAPTRAMTPVVLSVPSPSSATRGRMRVLLIHAAITRSRPRGRPSAARPPRRPAERASAGPCAFRAARSSRLLAAAALGA